MRPAASHIARQFVVVFVPLALVTGALIAAWSFSQSSARLAELQSNERAFVQWQSDVIVREFRAIAADVRVLARLRAATNVVSDPTPESRQRLAEDFALFLEHKPAYDQARFLDDTGREIVRANRTSGRSVIVPDSELQNKRDRYYVQATLALSPDEIYVSPFDLNVERGKIELPPKPTIRFATPVADEHGQKRGLVIVNYLGRALLDNLDRAGGPRPGRGLLVNADGFWLKGRHPEEEWGFMFQEYENRTFARQFPAAWERISATDQGQFQNDDGLFTFRTIHPAVHAQVAGTRLPGDARDAASGDAATRPEHWKIVSLVDAPTLVAQTQPLQSAEWRLAAGLGAVLVTVSWLLARVRAQHRLAADQLVQNERLAAIGEAMTGLAHESRNALQRSQAGLEMLAKRVQDRPEAVELLEEIRRAQFLLRDLYEEVRTYAAPMNLQIRRTDLGELVERTWRELVQVRPQCQVRLAVEDEASDLTCNVDAHGMGRALRNVLENALDASPPNGTVTVTFARDVFHGKPALRIAILDEGPGVPAEQRSRLFEPFYTTKARGTGLGLAIARRIVESHGGTLEIAGTNGYHGRGAELVFLVPREA